MSTPESSAPIRASGVQVRERMVALLPRLRRFARSLARNVHDADDLVQITIERALARLDQWRPEAPLEGWMFAILKNAWTDEIRARARSATVLAPAEAGEQVGIDPTEAHIQTWSVEAAMARLPEEQRLAVALVLVEGLSYKEAAAVMEVPMGTLTSRLARGREALEGLLRGGEPS